MVDDEAVVCMYHLAINEVMDNAAVVDTMAISEVVDAMAFDEGMMMRGWMMPRGSMGWWMMGRWWTR